jgi:CelD/BcsL family acetyltransferase involved in cellulose biosynthesis
VEIELLEDLADIEDAFECLTRFLNARWRNAAEGSVLDDPRLLRFHRHVLPRLASAGRLRMIRLSVGRRTIAVFYGLAAGRWWGYYLAGYDREWGGRIPLGKLTLAIAIECALREGACEFDFLKGAERTKYTWPVRDRATLDADGFSARPGAQLLRATRAARDTAAALSKSALSLFHD